MAEEAKNEKKGWNLTPTRKRNIAIGVLGALVVGLVVYILNDKGYFNGMFSFMSNNSTEEAAVVEDVAENPND